MTILSAFVGAMFNRPAIMTFSGLYSGFGASPLSVSRTVTVPAGNTGQLRFDSVSTDATFQYKIGAGAYTTVTGGATITVTNGATLEFRLTGGSATAGSCTLFDTSNGGNASTVSLIIA